MIQLFPNELQIQILTDVITKTNFEYFCTLRTVCKKWNTFVPLIMSEIVISRLNSDLELELTDWNESKWSKEMPPTYDDQTKTFTFLFNNDNHTNKRKVYKYDSLFFRKFNKPKPIDNFIAFVEKTDSSFFPIKIGAKFGSLAWPKFGSFLAWPKSVNNDLDKHEFDSKSNVCFKRLDDDKNDGNIRLYSFTIAAWKLYYILDCLQTNVILMQLREGFQYFYDDIYNGSFCGTSNPGTRRRRPCNLD
ncbi:21322_t:CDS:2 [Dentiscutata erythropus]|uniref:21322_t:CDS:1 n=1 Tax=Dentiscutata erythropus TaxID=1348616 RepID=A0A9N9DN67_9GLOM|nr:21322_t:CDS:2 [Dentiscutata erythropus]